jgi:hypothetical protein
MHHRHLQRERLKIQTPCSESWEGMQGDGQVRFCGRCEKKVYNLSAMAAEEAEALLARKRFGLCVKYAVRPDGTIVTGACPSAQARANAALALAAAALLTGATGCNEEQSEREFWAEVQVERAKLDEARKAEEERAWEAKQPPLSYQAVECRPGAVHAGDRTAEERKRDALMRRSTMGGPEPISPPFRKQPGMIDGPSLSPAQLSRVVQDRKFELQRCCQRHSAVNASQKVSLSLRVRRSGVVVHASATSEPQKPALERCLSAAVKHWRFPTAEGPSDFEFPIVCAVDLPKP